MHGLGLVFETGMPWLPRKCPLGIVVKLGEFSDLQVNLLELSRCISQNKPRVLGDAFGFWFGRRPNVHAHCDAGLGAFLRRFFFLGVAPLYFTQSTNSLFLA